MRLVFSVSSKSQQIIKGSSLYKQVSLISSLFHPQSIIRLPQVVDDYGLETVQEYMFHIRDNAEASVRSLLRDVAKRAGTNILTAIDYLDDGSPVRTTA
jgi:N-methylhydantoinase B/oxoprolinase/acetone carboxylase alpha subunit